ncbi:MAG: ATP-dependent helicase [Planctomycetota bacterium]
MTDAETILDGLTEPQREAVSHVEGPLLVVAGAGSGKTRVITRRVAYLCCQGIPPYRILAVTFTNKAAGEMRERIEALAGTGGAWVSTFHSLCARMLRMSAEGLGLPRNFSIYDRDDQLRTVREALNRTELGGSFTPSAALQRISNAKAKLWDAQAMARQADGFRDEMAAQVYTAYQRMLDANAALDFDDLLMTVALALDSDAAFRERWQRRFHYLLIDEYQDTNRAQYLIARTLAAQHRNLCATGDADQSIYGWRGANIANILSFTKDYPEARVVMLEQNFRSTKTILSGANSVIERNAQRHERGMWTENTDGVPIRFRLGGDADDEATIVLRELRRLHDAGRRWGDCAIFYRTNAQSRSFEEALVQASVPYRIVGAVEFYSRQEIKDIVAYLRLCVNPADDISLARIINRPSRGIGKQTFQRLAEWAEAQGTSLWDAVAAADEIDSLSSRATKAVGAFRDLIEGLRAHMDGPVAPLIERVLAETGYEDWLKKPENEERLQNVAAFLDKAAMYDEAVDTAGLAEFLIGVALVSDVDDYEDEADVVTLMTLHAAKGLEFPVVFITGLEEGLLPHANAMAVESEVEEERRLFYVGMTRAQEELVLTAAAERPQYAARDTAGTGSGWSRLPSRFLSEVSSSALDEKSAGELGGFQSSEDWLAEPVYRPRAGQGRSRRTADVGTSKENELAAAARREHSLSVGDWVMHPQYGKGRVETLMGSGDQTLATVALMAGGKRVFSLQHAALEKL